jgi:hypothetical protein
MFNWLDGVTFLDVPFHPVIKRCVSLCLPEWMLFQKPVPKLEHYSRAVKLPKDLVEERNTSYNSLQ